MPTGFGLPWAHQGSDTSPRPVVSLECYGPLYCHTHQRLGQTATTSITTSLGLGSLLLNPMASYSSGMAFFFLVNMVMGYHPVTLSHRKIVARPRAMEKELVSFRNGLSSDAKYDHILLH